MLENCKACKALRRSPIPTENRLWRYGNCLDYTMGRIGDTSHSVRSANHVLFSLCHIPHEHFGSVMENEEEVI